MTWQIIIGDVVIAVCFFTIGRSITRIHFSRVVRKLAGKYRQDAFAISDQLTKEWDPNRAERLRERADNLLGKAEALCALVDRV